MTDVVRINATIDRSLLDRVDQYAASNSEDRSTAIRQLLRVALRELAKFEAIAAYREGRLTLRQLAETLDLDVWGAHDLLASEGVAIAQGGRRETAADLEALLSSR
jgi:predicted HTH domain antitoxin